MDKEITEIIKETVIFVLEKFGNIKVNYTKHGNNMLGVEIMLYTPHSYHPFYFKKKWAKDILVGTYPNITKSEGSYTKKEFIELLEKSIKEKKDE